MKVLVLRTDAISGSTCCGGGEHTINTLLPKGGSTPLGSVDVFSFLNGKFERCEGQFSRYRHVSRDRPNLVETSALTILSTEREFP